MALKILSAFRREPKSLKYELHRRLAGWEEPRPHFPLRASDLMSTKYEFCPREHAFMDLGLAKKRANFVGTSLRMTYHHGSYMERKLRDEILRDMVRGEWECHFCKYEWPHFGASPTLKCPKCQSHEWDYREPRFGMDIAGVSGGVDMLLDMGQHQLTLIEVKTMTIEDFKTLIAPLAEHKARTNLYLRLVSESTHPHAFRINTKQARILYVVKSFGIKDTTIAAEGIKDAAFSPFKEFIIQRDDTLTSPKLKKARVLKVWRDEGRVGMPCGICANGMVKRAVTCPAQTVCWGGKFPSTLTWTENGDPKHANKIVIDL